MEVRARRSMLRRFVNHRQCGAWIPSSTRWLALVGIRIIKGRPF
jgi:hypothetical protein